MLSAYGRTTTPLPQHEPSAGNMVNRDAAEDNHRSLRTKRTYQPCPVLSFLLGDIPPPAPVLFLQFLVPPGPPCSPTAPAAFWASLSHSCTPSHFPSPPTDVGTYSDVRWKLASPFSNNAAEDERLSTQPCLGWPTNTAITLKADANSRKKGAGGKLRKYPRVQLALHTPPCCPSGPPLPMLPGCKSGEENKL